jgi:hypothetical protein
VAPPLAELAVAAAGVGFAAAESAPTFLSPPHAAIIAPLAKPAIMLSFIEGASVESSLPCSEAITASS